MTRAPAIPRCAICNDIGLVPVLGEGPTNSRPCVCQRDAATKILLDAARFPDAYSGASLGNFEKVKHAHLALVTARAMVREFIPGKGGHGLLLSGSVGTGKTHLAVAIGRQLVEDLALRVHFADVRDLLQRLRQSYDSGAHESEAQILMPLRKAELVILDELGAVRPTDWAFETTEAVIGTLYNKCTRVIVTTNFANLPPGGSTGTGYERAARQETLGDRIGIRMWSRLQQMCMAVDMTGPDYRERKEQPRG